MATEKRAVITGDRAPYGACPATAEHGQIDEEHWNAWAPGPRPVALICTLAQGHDKDHWDPIDRVLWRLVDVEVQIQYKEIA